jgi:hypothetical protein
MSTPTNHALDDVAQAYIQRRAIADRLQKQDAYIGRLVREARAGGATWARIAEEAGTSDVAVLKAARRMDPEEHQRAG